MRKIIELALFTDKVPEMTVFYKHLTGTDPAYASAQMALFNLGDFTLLIHEKSEPEADGPPNIDHFAFGAGNLAEAHQTLAAQGLRLKLNRASSIGADQLTCAIRMGDWWSYIKREANLKLPTQDKAQREDGFEIWGLED